MDKEIDNILKKYKVENTLIIIPKNNQEYQIKQVLADLESNLEEDLKITFKNDLKINNNIILEINLDNKNINNNINKNINNKNIQINDEQTIKSKLSEYVKLLKIIIKNNSKRS